MSGFTVTFGGGSGNNVAVPPVASIPASDDSSTKASPFQVSFKGGTVSSGSTVAVEQTASSIKRPGGFSISLVGGGGDGGGGADRTQQQESEGKISKPRRKQKGPHIPGNESGGTGVSVHMLAPSTDFGAGRKVVLTPDTTEKSKSRINESRDSASGNKASKSKSSDKNQDNHHIEQHQHHHHHEDQRRIKQQQPAIGRTVTIETSQSFTTKAATTSTTPTTGAVLPDHLNHLPFDTRMRIQKDITRGVLRNDGSPRSNFNFGQLNVINGQLAAAAGASDTHGGGKGGGGRAKPPNINSKPIVMRPEFDRERNHDSDLRGKYDSQHGGVPKGPTVQIASRSREQGSFSRSKSTVNSNTPQSVSIGSSSVNMPRALGDSECSQIDDSVPVEVWVPPTPTNPESLKPYRRTKNWGDDDDEDD